MKGAGQHLIAAVVVLQAWALTAETNPALPGFDEAGSDPRAIEIADAVMERLGGRANWDATRYLTWRFFGKRLHVWDKWTGDLRFEQGDLVVLMNIHSREAGHGTGSRSSTLTPSLPDWMMPTAPGSTTAIGW